MAKQNFLAGGFYGKLGAMVGQRWKNKRTIRTYVIPHNPNTPEQRKNRNGFAGAVQFAQMGMQMNYYCALFDNPNFTRWNYRMSVARNLKFAGMQDLNLIPLYPIDFTPPLVISQIKVQSVSGNRHVTFSVPDLTWAEDRVFSLMFALYENAETFLGYKLYLGYYYKEKPQVLEVDVDDVAEINENCYVRLVTNDDVDSKTDMIASAKLKVQTNGKDEHEFDCNVSLIEKTTLGMTITFREPWLEGATTNNVSLLVSFVSDGQRKVASVSNSVLENNNGLCSVQIPYLTVYNQDLPAFPEGSFISSVNVQYEGPTYKITLTDGHASFFDTDLERSLDKPFEHSNDDSVKVSVRVPFLGSVSDNDITLNFVTDGRFGDSSILTGLFSMGSDGSYLNFRCNNLYKNYAMRENTSYVEIPALSVVAEGVTYKKTLEQVHFSNDVTTSTYIIDKSLSVDYLKTLGDESAFYQQFMVGVYGVKATEGEGQDVPFISKITNPNGSVVTQIDSYSEVYAGTTDYDITFYNLIDQDPNYESVNENSTMTFLGGTNGNVHVKYNNVWYDTGRNIPKVADWTLL